MTVSDIRVRVQLQERSEAATEGFHGCGGPCIGGWQLPLSRPRTDPVPQTPIALAVYHLLSSFHSIRLFHPRRHRFFVRLYLVVILEPRHSLPTIHNGRRSRYLAAAGVVNLSQEPRWFRQHHPADREKAAQARFPIQCHLCRPDRSGQVDPHQHHLRLAPDRIKGSFHPRRARPLHH